MAAGGATNGAAEEARRAELERLVAELERLGPVEARGRVEAYFELAALYLKAGLRKRARQALEAGLRVDAWRLRDQLALARLLVEDGESEAAMEKARFVRERASDAALRQEAGLLLQDQNVALGPPERESARSRITLPDHTLYILPLGEAEAVIVGAIARRIAEEFGVGTATLDPSPVPAEPSRAPLMLLASTVFDDLVRGASRADLAEAAARAGVSLKELETHAGRVAFIRAHLRGASRDRFEALLASLPEVQYDGEKILQALSRAHSRILRGPRTLGLLGVMAEDIFAGGTNFVFGLAGPRCGLLSYVRFFAAPPPGVSPEAALVKRAVMQAFSSAGMIIGIPRCTSPSCARAYPHSLAEHDRKEERICTECRARLEARLRELKGR